MNVKDIFKTLTNFIIFCVVVGIFITQIIFTFIISPSNFMLWQLMVIVASSNIVAVILGVYGYHSVEKRSLYLERTPDFQETLLYIARFSKIIKDHFTEDEEDEEFKEVFEIVINIISKYLKGKKSLKNKEILRKLSIKEAEDVYEIVENLRD